jgi:Kinesin motor domain
MGTPDSPGLIPRITSNLFSAISHLTTPDDTCTVHISYFEIYNEQVRDLLAAVPQQFTDSKVQQGGLRVRERKDGTVFIEGLNEFQCKGFEDVLAFMKMGNKVRTSEVSLFVFGFVEEELTAGAHHGADVNERHVLPLPRRLHNLSPPLHQRRHPRINSRENLPL